MLDTLPAEILILYLLLYFFGKHLYFSPRLFLLLCLRFSLSRFTALATVLFFTLLWLAMFVGLFYFGHTLFLLAIFPFLLLPHLYRGISYFRSIITRLSLWVIFTIAFRSLVCSTPHRRFLYTTVSAATTLRPYNGKWPPVYKRYHHKILSTRILSRYLCVPRRDRTRVAALFGHSPDNGVCTRAYRVRRFVLVSCKRWASTRFCRAHISRTYRCGGHRTRCYE